MRKVERSDGLLSFGDVQERLVEAMLVCWRLPDRERGMMRVRAHWPDVQGEAGDYDARGGAHSSSDVALRPASLTRAEVGAMEQAFAWVQAVDGDDRKLIGLAVAQLARGKQRVPWLQLRAPMGLTIGAGGLARRYDRAMAKVVVRANRGQDR